MASADLPAFQSPKGGVHTVLLTIILLVEHRFFWPHRCISPITKKDPSVFHCDCKRNGASPMGALINGIDMGVK